MSQPQYIKDVPGYEGIYAVTRDGRVFSYKRRRFLKPYTTHSKTWGEHGRPLVDLMTNGKKKMWFVSKLVYITFVGEIPNNHDIDHINGIKNDNRIENLRPLTRAENMLAYHDRRFGLTRVGR